MLKLFSPLWNAGLISSLTIDLAWVSFHQVPYVNLPSLLHFLLDNLPLDWLHSGCKSLETSNSRSFPIVSSSATSHLYLSLSPGAWLLCSALNHLTTLSIALGVWTLCGICHTVLRVYSLQVCLPDETEFHEGKDHPKFTHFCSPASIMVVV